MIWCASSDFVTLGLILSYSRDPKVTCLLNNANLIPIFDSWLPVICGGFHACSSPITVRLDVSPHYSCHMFRDSLPLAKEV